MSPNVKTGLIALAVVVLFLMIFARSPKVRSLINGAAPATAAGG